MIQMTTENITRKQIEQLSEQFAADLKAPIMWRGVKVGKTRSDPGTATYYALKILESDTDHRFTDTEIEMVRLLDSKVATTEMARNLIRQARARAKGLEKHLAP